MSRFRRGFKYATLIALIVAALISLTIPAYRESIYVCEITGSTRSRVTWFGVIRNDTYTISPLEEYVRSRGDGTVKHSWVWLSASERNILGGRLLVEDTSHPTDLLAQYFRYSSFVGLPDDNKTRIYEILLDYSGQRSDDDKRKVFRELLRTVERDDTDLFIRKYWTGKLPERDA
jgi:hypothetical protein